MMLRRRAFVAGLSAAATSFPADAQRPGWIDSERRQQLRELQMSLIRRYRIPASVVAIIKDGEFVDSLTMSQTLGELQSSFNPDTYFQVASISKVVTAIVVLRLAEQRKLSLDAPVNTMLRSWQLTGVSQPYVDAVTPRLLLCHRAGTNVPGFPGYLSGAPLPTLVEILNGAPPANTPRVIVDRRPGEAFRYSSGGTTILQQLVVDITGRPFADLTQELVFAPTGMKAASFTTPPANRGVPAAHDEQGRPLPGRYHVYPELAAAGLWCAMASLVELARALAASWSEGGLLSQATARMMATAVADGPTGLGVFVQARPGKVPILYHGGVNVGFHSVLAFAADSSFGVAIATNGEGGQQLIPAYGEALFQAAGQGRFPLG